MCVVWLLALALPAGAEVTICRGHLQGSRLDEPAIMVWGQETL